MTRYARNLKRTTKIERYVSTDRKLSKSHSRSINAKIEDAEIVCGKMGCKVR